MSNKKTIVRVELLCSKCKKKVMKLIAGIEGINSVSLDTSKSTVTVTGDADPFEIIRQVRKFRKTAEFVSIGPQKEEKKEEKKETSAICYVPKTCQRCDVWYVVGEDPYHYCSIL